MEGDGAHFKRMDGKRKGLFNFIQYIYEPRIIRRGTWYYMKEREKIGRQGDFLQVATYPLCLQKPLLSFYSSC